MRKVFGSQNSIVVLLLIVFAIISIIGKYRATNTDQSLVNSAEILQQYIVDFDNDFETIIAENTIDSFSFQRSSKFVENPKQFLILYSNDAPIFWTNNSISFPSLSQIKNDSRSIQKLKNVWSYVSTYKYDDSTYLVGVLPIKYTQDIKNNYLTDEFIVKKVGEQFDINKDIANAKHIIHNKYDAAIFSIVTKDIAVKYDGVSFYAVINLILLVLILFSIYILCDYLSKSISEWIALAILIPALVGLRLLFYFDGWMYNLQNSSLFDPTLLGSNYVNSSLGIFMINTLIFALIAYFFYTHIRYRKSTVSSRMYQWVGSLWFIFLYLSHNLLIYLYKDIIVNSTIPLDLTNILKVNVYSIIVYSIFAVISLAYVFISLNLFKLFIRKEKISVYYFAIYNGIAMLCSAAFINYCKLDTICYAGIVVMLLWNCLLYFYFSKKVPFASIYDMIIILGFVSLVSAIYSNFFNVIKNTIITADAVHKLSDDRDYVTEFSFTDIHCRVTDDVFLKRMLLTNLHIGNSDAAIINRIEQLYFKNYLSKYNLDIHLFNSGGYSLLAGDTIPLSYYQETIDKYGFETSDIYLHFIEKSSENYYYAAVVPVFNDTTMIGLVSLNLKPKVSNDDNVYPELLISKNLQKNDESSEASYLVINNNRILKSKGSIPYEYTNLLSSPIAIDSFIEFSDQHKVYTIYKPTARKSIIYCKDKISFYKYVTSFSYILIIYILVFFILFLTFSAFKLADDFKSKPWNSLSLSFHDKINFTLFSLLLFSFFAIAIITTWFIGYQYETNNKQNLINISIRASTKLQEFIFKNSIEDDKSISLKEDFSYLIPQLSNDEKIDINLFDTKGNLAMSSQFSIFEKGLQATKMNPRAYSALKNKVTNQVTQEESIGKLSYLSLYMPLYNDKNQLLAYMNIPYFSQTKTLKDEISRFLVALINVYVPLLLITGFLALLISNSLTKPLNQIGNQLRKIRLGKVNESIEWHQKDEIGLLVEEYNKMIKKLDASAISLKKNEREVAWREMAKQIAHEIKNPLTPMRLSIQFLQRALLEKNPNALQLTNNMTETLLEQIDNLSEIATAFSTFAQMPVANNEKLDLDHYLSSIINLFSEEHNVTINYQAYTKPAWIFADKNQMISLFNNLIKNAIQACKDDTHGLIDVFLLEEYGTIKVIIIDNGKGIPDEIKDRIFTPNFTTKNSGSGLGLAIAKQIVESVGGSIWFESQENISTTFYVVIPKFIEQSNDIV